MAAAQDLTIRRWEEAAAIARPLTPPEREALATDIAARGVIYPVMVLPDGRIVDGHHRWELSNEQAPITILPPMTDQAALYLAGQLNIARRHLDRADWNSQFHKQERKAAALAMLEVKTQAEVATVFGVGQKTVSDWKKAAEIDTLAVSANVSDPAPRRTNNYPIVRDHRKKLTELERKDIVRRYRNGESNDAIAARFNIHERTVYRIANGKDRPTPALTPTVATAPKPAAPDPTDDEGPAYQRVTRSRRVYSFDTPLTAPSGASLKGWSATILSIIEFTKALRDQGVRPLVRQWSPRKLEVTLANLDLMIGQIQQLRAEVAAAMLNNEPDPDGPA
jgi:ParB-like chromosome segregation protein Spo0J